MDVGYLEYLEGAVASVSSGSLLRLAGALETTADELAGGGIELPPGRGGAGRAPVLDELSREEGERLLAGGGVGRVVFATEAGPEALPVNFRVLDGDVVFRTAEGGALARVVGAGAPVAFEVDHVDEALAEGWSVLIRGQARPIVEADELARVKELGVEPWAGGERGVFVRLAAETLTGRRIRVRR